MAHKLKIDSAGFGATQGKWFGSTFKAMEFLNFFSSDVASLSNKRKYKDLSIANHRSKLN
jgi:hypothetical protein